MEIVSFRRQRAPDLEWISLNGAVYEKEAERKMCVYGFHDSVNVFCLCIR